MRLDPPAGDTNLRATPLAAALADRYRVERELGAGGMATVYLAHDLKHDRDVAIKVLHPELGAALGGERFLSEIRTTAKLQHPHILPLLDSGSAEGLLYYVMPYVAGETLRARLDRERQLPIADTVRVTREVAAALDYAHRQGVIHRDIKPENILLHDDSALVADFGIALAVQQAGGQRMTQTGLSLGTPQYMSPEQAMGEKSIDARSDIYALGAVCYEMLTGAPPFTGATVQAIVARVLTERPAPIRTVRDTVPAHIEDAVLTALAKLPADRWPTVASFAGALDLDRRPRGPDAPHSWGTGHSGDPGIYAGYPPEAGGKVSRLRGNDSVGGGWRARLRDPVQVALLAVALAAVGAFAWGRASARGATPRAATMASLNPSPNETWRIGRGGVAMSPDGRKLAIVADRGDWRGLVIRALDSLASAPLAATAGVSRPFWSPDGRSIGFFADGQLKVVDLASGAVRALCPAARPTGGTWGADDVILYTPEEGAPVHRTSPSRAGCAPLPIRMPARALVSSRPQFLGDGRHFVVGSDRGVWLAEVDGDSVTWLADVPLREAVAAGPDYLLYTPTGSPSNTVFAQRIDLRARRLVGEPVKLLSRVPAPRGEVQLAASNAGALVARVQFDDSAAPLLGRFAGGGARPDTIPSELFFGSIAFSRDGRRAAFGGFRIAVLDVARRAWTELVKPVELRTPVLNPIWSPADTAVAFVASTQRGDSIRLVDTRTATVRSLDGDAKRVRHITLTDWSPDGRFLAFQYEAGGGSASDEAWVYDVAGRSRRRMFEENGSVGEMRFSPDGRLVAYQLERGGVRSVYVRPFPGPGAAVRAGPAGSWAPRWGPATGGLELFYVTAAGGIDAVRLGADGAPTAAPRGVLAGGATSPTKVGALTYSSYDVSPTDGSILAPLTGPQFQSPTLTLMLDWWTLMPARR